MASQTGYAIINRDRGSAKNSFFYGDTFGSLDAVLNQYIKDVMGYGRAFPLSEEVWESISERMKIRVDTQINNELSDKIYLINGLCKVERYKIKHVLVNYTTVFG